MAVDVALITVTDPPPVDGMDVPLMLVDPGPTAWVTGEDPDVPETGDPDAVLTPAVPRRLGRHVQVLLKRPGLPCESELQTVSQPVRRLRLDPRQGSQFSFVTHREDPGWGSLTQPAPAIVRNRRGLTLDPQRMDAEIIVDGRRRFCGCFAGSPRRIDGDYEEHTLIDGLGVAASLDVRTPWADDHIDMLDGRGSFEGTSPLAGWEVEGSLDLDVLTPTEVGPYLGRAVRANGIGILWSPWVWTSAEEGTVGWEGSARVHLTEPYGSQTVGTRTQVVRPVGSLPFPDVGFEDNRGHASSRAGIFGFAWEEVKSDRKVMWSVEPAGLLLVRTGVEIISGDNVYIDEVRIERKGITAVWPGDLSGRSPDFSNQVALALRASVLRDPSSGWTISQTPTGVSAPGVSWEDDSHTRASEAIVEVTGREDGPDVWCDTNWAFRIAARRGSNRTDLILDDFCAVDASWERQPQIDAITAYNSTGAVRRWNRATPPDKRRVEVFDYGRGAEASARTEARWQALRERLALLPPVTGMSLLPMSIGPERSYPAVVPGDGVKVNHRRGFDTAANFYRVGETVDDYTRELTEVHWGADVIMDGVSW